MNEVKWNKCCRNDRNWIKWNCKASKDTCTKHRGSTTYLRGIGRFVFVIILIIRVIIVCPTIVDLLSLYEAEHDLLPLFQQFLPLFIQLLGQTDQFCAKASVDDLRDPLMEETHPMICLHVQIICSPMRRWIEHVVVERSDGCFQPVHILIVTVGNFQWRRDVLTGTPHVLRRSAQVVTRLSSHAVQQLQQHNNQSMYKDTHGEGRATDRDTTSIVAQTNMQQYTTLHNN